MAKTKKPRHKAAYLNAAKTKNDIVQAAKHPIEPPKYMKLSSAERASFDRIISKKANLFWDEQQIHKVANLARLDVFIVQETAKLLKEGSVVQNAKGDPVKNPRLGNVAQLCSIWQREIRLLGLHATAQTRDTKGIEQRNIKSREIQEQALAALNKDDKSSRLLKGRSEYLQ